MTSTKYEQFDASGSRIIYDISEIELGLIEPTQPKREELPSQDALSSINLESKVNTNKCYKLYDIYIFSKYGINR